MSERPITRRAALGAAALGAGFVPASCAAEPSSRIEAAGPRTPSVLDSPVVDPGRVHRPVELPPPTPPAPKLDRVPAPSKPIAGLPGDRKLLAWTVDDGTNSAVVAAYAAFAAETGTRLTLFATGAYPAWRENAAALAPLVKSGQVQIGNHTWTHPDLRKLSDQGIRDELQRTHDLIGELWNVDARPFFRPPFGFYDSRVLSVAAGAGYTAPTMWYGSLADSGYNPEDQIVALARQWFLPERVVIGHLNFVPVTRVLPQLAQIIADRGLTTVTLNDVFSSGFHP